MENQDRNELNELKEEFKNWRENRPGKKGTTLEELKNKAIKLLENYSVTQISKELNVYPKQLRKWQSDLSNCNQNHNYQETEISFLETTPQRLVQAQAQTQAQVSPASLQSSSETFLTTPSTPSTLSSTSTQKLTPQLCSIVIERTDGNRLTTQLALNIENLDILFSFIKA